MSEKILNTIKKLIASRNGENAIGNVAAAEAFADKISELLRRYNLTMSDVELSAAMGEKIEAEQVNHILQTIEAWQCHLLQNIAVANGCMSLDNEAGFQIVIGRESDRRIVIEFYRYFEKLAWELAEADLRAYKEKRSDWYFVNSEAHFKEYRRSFLAGFAVTIGNRFAREKESVEAAVVNERALVFLGSKAKDAMDYAFDKFKVEEVRQTEKPMNRQGFYSGLEQGERVALTTKVIE